MKMKLVSQPPHIRKMVKEMTTEACRYCRHCKIGNDENNRLALFCHLWKDYILKAHPFDRCELFSRGEYDKYFEPDKGEQND